MPWINPIVDWDGTTPGRKYFNFGDLNRIENNTLEIENLLLTIGCGVNISIGSTNTPNATPNYAYPIYGGTGIGQRLDGINIPRMFNVQSLSFIASKTGSPTALYVSIFDETAGTIVYPKTNIISQITNWSGVNIISLNAYVIPGHILQVRLDDNGLNNSSNYVTLYYGGTRPTGQYMVSTTNNWTAISQNIYSNLLLQVDYKFDNLTVVTSRDNTSLIFYDDLNRIENNILALASATYSPPNWISPKINWSGGTKFDFNDANRLESNLLNLKLMIDQIVQGLLYTGDSMTTVCGKGNTLF